MHHLDIAFTRVRDFLVRGVVSPVFTQTTHCDRRYWTKGCHLQVKMSRRQKGKAAVVPALVDTGAAFTVIRKDVFETFAPISTLAPHSTVGIDALQSATGSSIKVHGVAQAFIAFDHSTVVKTKALVQEEVIIGVNTLTGHGMSILFESDHTLTAYRKSFPLRSKSYVIPKHHISSS